MKNLNLVKFNRTIPALTKKQKTLYSFICNKLEKDEDVKLEEVKEIWLKHSCRNVINGIPHINTWKMVWGDDGKAVKDEHGRDKITWVDIPMDQQQIKQAVTFYFMSGIGSLVMSGALKIIPTIDFN